MKNEINVFIIFFMYLRDQGIKSQTPVYKHPITGVSLYHLFRVDAFQFLFFYKTNTSYFTFSTIVLHLNYTQ